MLGEKGGPGVSQAAWVRGLLSTFFATGRGSGRYGLFQSNLRGTDEPLDWSWAQQAAFLAMLWSDIGASIQRSAHQHWWIRCYESDATAALTDRTSMLNQDMGIRAILSVANDLFFRRAREWGLDQWDTVATGSSDAEDVSAALDSLSNTRFRPQISSFAEGLVRFDWRSFDGPRVNPDEGRTKRAYRGSGGYTVLAEDILREVSDGQDPVATTAAILLAKQV